jgi:Zn-finger nucleic acid-binding protein
MTERQGIEIDYCPKCRGVWLDRGELDKLIERSAPASAAQAPTAQATAASRQAPPGRRYEYDDDDDDERERYDREGYPKKRRKSLLGELFDF